MSPRIVADGANQFRRRGALERFAAQLSKVAIGPSLRQSLKRIYLRALTWQTRGKGLEASLPGGEAVRVLPEYAFLSWNPDEYHAFRDTIRPGMTALDVGANVGAYSLLLGQWVGASGAVYAFEPAPTPFDGLTRHIRLNALDSIVTAIPAAVGAARTTARLVVGSTAGESRLANRHDTQATTVDVAVTTIDEFCAERRLTPDFIKIDVEGAELDVLRGARATIGRLRDTLALFVELHPSIWRTAGLTVSEIKDELDTLGLDVVPLQPGADPWTIEGICVRLVPRS
jgi:FkbM family methyltransferase